MTAVRKLHQTLQPIAEDRLQLRIVRERRWRIEVQPVEPVVAIRARDIEVVAETEVEGQTPADLPIVVDVGAEVACGLCGRIVYRHHAAATEAEERGSQSVTLRGTRHQRVLRRLIAAEGEAAIGSVRLEVVLVILPIFYARLDAVTGLDLRHRTGELIDVLEAMDDGIPARAHRTVTGAVTGKRKHTRSLDKVRQTEFLHCVETDAERIAN